MRLCDGPTRGTGKILGNFVNLVIGSIRRVEIGDAAVDLLSFTSGEHTTGAATDRSEQFGEWLGDRRTRNWSTNEGARSLAFQGWRNFKEAFAPELIGYAVKETSRDLRRPVRACSDPFGGSGTTSIACQFLGVRPITCEVNPYLADLIEAKLTTYPPNTLERAFARIMSNTKPVRRRINLFPGAPPTFVEPGVDDRYIFSLPTAQRIAALRDAILAIRNPAVRRFFRVILGSVVIPVSNVVISGKGRRYRRNWTDRAADPNAVCELFSETCLRAIYEIARHANRPQRQYEMHRGDSRALAGDFTPHDLSIFSPPYPNSFDYTDVYNVELWALGYLKSGSDNRALREATLRSHVQIRRSFDTVCKASRRRARTLSQLRSVKDQLWNPHIPDMVNAYFDDMQTILCNLNPKLASRGRVFMVVGDSRYCGVDVPVARILADEAESAGYQFLGSEPFRSMRASPQQGGRLELAETLIALRKP